MSLSDQSTERCPLCHSDCSQHAYELHLRSGRRSISVQGLKHWFCGACSFDFTDEAQSAHNLDLIESATRQQQGVVTPGLMRQLRKTWGLTQAMASKLFGAGDSSFAKWESGQSNISRPAALLIQAASHVPGVMAFLAQLAKIELHPIQAAHWGGSLKQAQSPEAYQNWNLSVEMEMATSNRVTWHTLQRPPARPANDAYMEIARQARIGEWRPHLNTVTQDKVVA
jgi:HTH-type transcriptional regulator / antitoxin MqsA